MKLKGRIACAALLFGISLTVYCSTLAPTVVFVDSGELIVAAKSLGVAHPPGFPLYILLAHLATKLPFGSVAARVNFASALFASFAIAFLFLLVYEIFESQSLKAITPNLRSRGKKKIQTRDQVDVVKKSNMVLAAMLAALTMAFSRTFWSFATVAEVYTLNTLLITAIFYLLFRWRSTVLYGNKLSPNQTGMRSEFAVAPSLVAAAFLFGLALGVHHVSVVVTLPALALLVYRTAGRQFFASKALIYTALASIAGLTLTYLYLPLAASRAPVMNWGDPQTLQRLWGHVSGRQYQVFISFSPQQISDQAVEFAKLTSEEFGPIWFPATFILAALRFWALFSRDRTTFWFLALVIIFDVGYALNYEIAEDKGAYYLPAFLALTIAVSFGASWFARFLVQSSNQRLSTLAVAIMFVIPAAAFPANLPFTNRHNFYLARHYINNIESTIGPRGMLLTSDWQVYSPFLYTREIEQQRRDIVAMDCSLLRRSWYYDYLRTQYPDLWAENREQIETFLADLRHWESDPGAFSLSAELTRRINDHYFGMIRSFVSSHVQSGPVYVTWGVGVGLVEDPELTKTLSRDYQFVPQGLVFQLSRDRNFQTPQNPQFELTGLNDNSFKFDPEDVVMLKVFPVYTNMMTNRGRYLAAYGRYEEAISAYQQALQLNKDFKPAVDSLSEAVDALRRDEKGKR